MKISNIKGLNISVLPSGSVGAIEVGSTRINLRKPCIHGASGTNIFARIHDHNIRLMPLTGPMLNGTFGMADNKYYFRSESHGLKCVAELKLSSDQTAWMWTLMLNNSGEKSIKVDAVCVQDVGLRQGSGLVNEYYVSQYIERRLFDSELYGKVATCRQNMAQDSTHPWLLMACLEGAVAGATDGAQIFGAANRNSEFPPGLFGPTLGGEYAGESSLLALQSKCYTLNPGVGTVIRFMFLFANHHPGPSSIEDIQYIRPVLGSFDAFNPMPYIPWKRTSLRTFFNVPNYLGVRDLTSDELTRFFGTERLHAEHLGDQLQSFFLNNGNHVVLKSKELMVDRPHGHIIRSGNGLLPNERIMSTNPFMAGVFNAHVTAGNTNFNVLHSIYSNPFGVASPHGQRVFVKQNSHWHLLGVPSAFEMGFNYCRWMYCYDEVVLEIVTWTSTEAHQVNFRLKFLSGDPADIRIANHFDSDSRFSINLENNFDAKITPAADTLLGSHFAGACFTAFLGSYDGIAEVAVEKELTQGDAILVYSFTGTTVAELSFGFFHEGETPQKATAVFEKDALPANWAWRGIALDMELRGSQPDIQAINTILPWFGTNALTHYLTPYGLEQFGGAAWGTRDVSQGPIELMLSLGRYQEAKQILRIIFSNQHPDGGWPQWWMFDSYASIRAHEAHGDITYWVMIALSNYLLQTDDFGFLHEQLPWFNPASNTFTAAEPLLAHIEKWLKMITDSFIEGTALVPFGGGDWNDSLQPASSLLAARLISSWTVQMSYQAFSMLAEVFKGAGLHTLATHLLALSDSVRRDFHAHLVKDGVVAGYGKLHDDKTISLLLHPSDSETGISYSILPMNRGVLSNIFAPEQADSHMEVIRKYLKGPDGARLMDKPLKYSGGRMRIFQRAETSTFFGREIGLMYVHEHIRHAEALAILGRADEFVVALRQAIPVDYHQIVENAAPRQSNCYYSSSDIVFANRYQADEDYHLLQSGKLTFRGGWRIYSSGPGIFVSLVVNRLLGLRFRKKQLIIDPVLPFAFDGLEVVFHLLGKPTLIKYYVKKQTHSPNKIILNGRALAFATEKQTFRSGGAILAIEGLKPLLKDRDNLLEIFI